MADEKMTLTNIGEGAAVELFQEELARVLNNCLDVNMPWRAKREITIKVSVIPNEDRDRCGIEISCSSNLAKPKTYPTNAFLCQTPDGPVAIEQARPKQQSIFDKAPHDNVRPIGERG